MKTAPFSLLSESRMDADFKSRESEFPPTEKVKVSDIAQNAFLWLALWLVAVLAVGGQRRW